MSIRLFRLALVGFAATTLCGVLGGVPAHAAPYTEDPSIAVSTPNPAVGGTLTGTLSDFAPHEFVDVRLHSRVVDLTTVSVDDHGDGTFVVTLPPGFTCSHHLTGTGESSGVTAGTNVVIGPIGDCTGDDSGDDADGKNGAGGGDGFGNHGNGNTGYGNHGDHNSGFGNHGNGNTGSGNHGDNNSGFGNHGNGGGSAAAAAAANWGNAAYAEPQDPSRRGGLELAGAGAGLAIVAIVGGGVVTARRRRLNVGPNR